MEKSAVYILSPPPDAGPRHFVRRATATLRPATRFFPQDKNLSPEIHFPLQTVFAPDRPPFPRFVNRFDSREILLVVDGSCLNNGRHANRHEPPRAGCSFTFKDGPTSDFETPAPPVTYPYLNRQEVTGSIAFRMEEEGPFGHCMEHTSNRAKLRAVIAALQFRPWDAEGWRRVVILTDLEYIVHGATTWLPHWVRRNWRARRGGRYSNRDLWEELQNRIDELHERGCEVSFWLVRRGHEEESLYIAKAKAAAQLAARSKDPNAQMGRFTKLCGIML
ncbi:hypothetical protein OQA88_7951 [Cercophora sp. LCS_1]